MTLPCVGHRWSFVFKILRVGNEVIPPIAGISRSAGPEGNRTW
jgi:hypothetical protein